MTPEAEGKKDWEDIARIGGGDVDDRRLFTSRVIVIDTVVESDGQGLGMRVCVGGCRPSLTEEQDSRCGACI